MGLVINFRQNTMGHPKPFNGAYKRIELRMINK
jgi:hypothetical protein